uniref:zinc finger CCCH domain-containing protein 48-like n=1 Tax=Erigeron canadensis TaxID=72917 RepID=UPI001CB9413A
TASQENIARNYTVKPVVCKYWLEGRCTRNPCKFLHPVRAKVDNLKSKYAWKNPSTTLLEVSKNKENCDYNYTAPKKQQKVAASKPNTVESQSIEKVRNCMEGEKCEVIIAQSKSTEPENFTKVKICEKLQSWFSGNGLSVVAKLEGHTKAVTGIVYPFGSKKLFCASKDRSLRVWDCNSGQCGTVINFDDECGTLVKEGPWIFAGLRDMIKAWNLETQSEVVIRASGGQVNAITMYEDILFAGMESGTILSWKSTAQTSFSEEATSLKGHTGAVLSLIIGAKRLYSGSADHTIRVWGCESLRCSHVLSGHTSDVTAVLCWDQYLFSGSLDNTIKVWGETESGSIEQVYKHEVNNGVLALRGMHDAEEKPIMLCSCRDDGVHLYDLPSFSERGRIFSQQDIQGICIGPEGLFFTGDAAGVVTVWKPSAELGCRNDRLE